MYTHKPETLFIHLTSAKNALCNPCQTPSSINEEPLNEKEEPARVLYWQEKMGRCEYTAVTPDIPFVFGPFSIRFCIDLLRTTPVVLQDQAKIHQYYPIRSNPQAVFPIMEISALSFQLSAIKLLIRNKWKHLTAPFLLRACNRRSHKHGHCASIRLFNICHETRPVLFWHQCHSHSLI